MNKRIKKKLQNRFGYKKYSEYRIQRIYKALKDQIDNDTILYIVTGKRPNNKNFHSIKLLKHCVPTSIANQDTLSMTNDTENDGFTLSFSVGNYVNNKQDEIKEDPSTKQNTESIETWQHTVREMLNNWIGTIKRSDN